MATKSAAVARTQVMALPTTVVIVSAEHVRALRKRLKASGLTAVFSDSESLQALETVLADTPRVLIFDARFAATSRGATTISRIKAAPQLGHLEIRVLIEDEDKVPLFLSQAAASPEKTLTETSRPLDRVGTRRAARFPMNRRGVVVNGQRSQLVDLSVTGAQVLAEMRLRPNQLLRLILPDESEATRCQGTVVWSVAVPTGSSLYYRAGVEFINPDSTELEAFCAAFGGVPDRTFGAP